MNLIPKAPRAILVLLGATVFCLLALTGEAAQPWVDPAAQWTQTQVGPPNGALLICGGKANVPLFRLFLKLAGGPQAPIVVIPTASAGNEESNASVAVFRSLGAAAISVLHTTNPAVADTETFLAPLRQAKGVWIPGGRQWRLADAYLHTRAHRELFAVLDRGGVIGGSSAGASIQASYLVRGAPEGNKVTMAPGHEEGFGFLRRSAVDQHVLARNRLSGLIEVLEQHPDLLGIGIDEQSAILVRGDEFEVVGESQVAVYDPRRSGWPKQTPYTLLPVGSRYDLKARRLLSGWPASHP